MSKQIATYMNEDGLILSGYHKKLKTMKKKFFVLYKETVSNVARLEYYDNEKKFKSGLAPKRVIKLKDCFSINRRLDTKYDHVIALSTKEGGFGIVLESETDMFQWLEMLISLQRYNDNIGEPHFDHVWQVFVQKKGLAEEKGLVGNYHVCLTSKSITFIRIGSEKTNNGDARIANIEFMLTTVRRCGDTQCLFYVEVGRQSIIGPGELWMETADSLMAQNMHHMILGAMSNKIDLSMEPMRKRSSSANEASKPINVLQRKQTQPDYKPSNSPQINTTFGRERCDSLPSRNRHSSESSSSNQYGAVTSALIVRSMNSGHRSHVYQRHSNSPPNNSTIGCSESEESSISIDEPDDNGSFLSYRFSSRASEGVIPEENTDELVNSENKSNEFNDITRDFDINCQNLKISDSMQDNYVSMGPSKLTQTLEEANVLQQDHSTNSEDKAYMTPLSVANRTHQRVDNKCAEPKIENPYKSNLIEMDTQSQRPTRAYSIGSKVEHNRINKRLEAANEADQSTRVRAFSVGSRAKIPRCDLQRGVLFPKLMLEQNFNSSNNNICSVAEITTYKQLLNMNGYRDKKSTSAPLLIHKSQNSVDRMSDLMELDFSKTSSSTISTPSSTAVSTPTTIAGSINIHSPHFPKTHFSRSVPTTNRDHMKKIDGTFSNIVRENSLHSTILPSTLDTVAMSQTDNGYLEMKPVGNTYKSDSLNRSNQIAELKPKMTDYSTTLENRRCQKVINAALLQSRNEQNVGQLTKTITENSNITDKSISSSTNKSSEDIRNTPNIITSPTLLKYIFKKVSDDNDNNDNDNRNYDTTTTSNYNTKTMDAQIPTNTSSSPSSITSRASSLKPSPITIPKQLTKNTNEYDYININVASPTTTAKLDSFRTTVKQISSTQNSNKRNARDNAKLTHSYSDQTNKYDNFVASRKSSNTNNSHNESGYEILQIKSDSSLESHKHMNRPAMIRKDKAQQSHTYQQHQKYQIQPQHHSHISSQNRPKSTSNSSPLASSSSLSSSSSSSSTLCGYPSTSAPSANTSTAQPTVTPPPPTTPAVTTTTSAYGGEAPNNSPNNRLSNSTNDANNQNVTTTLTTTPSPSSITTTPITCITSRPSSVSSEHELYYASLDLPPCNNSEITVKTPIKIECFKEPPSPQAIINVNAYAKIHFEHPTDASTKLNY